MTQTTTITSPPVHEDQVLKLNEVSDKLFKGALETISMTNEDFSHFIDSHDAKSIEQCPNLKRFLK